MLSGIESGCAAEFGMLDVSPWRGLPRVDESAEDCEAGIHGCGDSLGEGEGRLRGEIRTSGFGKGGDADGGEGGLEVGKAYMLPRSSWLWNVGGEMAGKELTKPSTA